MRESILVPIHDSGPNECALPAAALLARATRTRLVLLWVESLKAQHIAEVTARRLWNDSQANKHLMRVAADLRQQGLEVDTHVEWTDSTSRIPAMVADTAAAQNAQLIIMCSGIQRGWTKRLGVSIADQVVAASSVPVFLIGPGNRLLGRKSQPVGMNLLVPLDGSAVDEIVLTHTTELARLLHVRLILIYTVSPLIVPESSVYSYQLVDKILDDQCEAGRSYLARLASQLEQEGLLVQAHVQIGNQVQALLKEVMAYRSAMMIVAVDHPTRLQRWAVGSVTDQLLEASDCPLIVLNGDQQTITQGDILPAQHRFRQNHV